MFVADIDRTLDFYFNRLGFTQGWRYEDNSKASVAQVDRQGCALIFSSQWPDKVGKGLMKVARAKSETQLMLTSTEARTESAALAVITAVCSEWRW